jgi:hypothetical protein
MLKFYKQFDKFFKLIILLSISAILIYFVPAAISKIAFLLLLILIWFSKNDYFWYAFILLILEQPGGLFSGGALNDPYRLPIYILYPGVSFGFEELYIFIILIKPLINKRLHTFKTFPFKRYFQILGLFLIVLIIVSLLLGMSSVSMRDTYKTLIRLSLYFTAVFIFKKEEDIIFFFKALFPFVFLAVFLQLYDITQNQQLVALLKPGATSAQGVLTGELLRPVEMSIVLMISLFGSFLFLGTGSKYFSRNYLILINVTSFLSILMTATRSWFMGFAAMYLFYIILNVKLIKRNVLYASLGIVFVIAILMLLPSVNRQVKQSWTRIQTLEEFAKGDITAGGTLSRLTVRGPRVMEGFKQSTIFLGAGFSNLFYEYGDGHVGYQNILFHSGIIGFLLLFLFAFRLYSKPYRLSLKTRAPDLKYILRNLPLVLPVVLIINSGTQFWGFNVAETSRVMFLAFYISIVGFYINQHYQDEFETHAGLIN